MKFETFVVQKCAHSLQNNSIADIMAVAHTEYQHSKFGFNALISSH